MAVNKKTEGKRHELIEGVIDHVTDFLQKAGFGADLAHQTGVSVADHIVDLWGGQNICFPVDYAYKTKQREVLIFSKFTGSNLAELAYEFRITERGLRKLIARAQARKKQNEPNCKGHANKKASAVPHADTSGSRSGGPGTVVSPDEVNTF